MNARRDRLRAALRRPFRPGAGQVVRRDDGSIMLALLVMIAVTAIGMVVTPMYLLQVGTTRSDVARATQLTAARTGLDVAVGHLRAANDGAGNGVLTGLPCDALLGSTSSGPSGQYSAAVSYYASDPSFKTTAQVTADAMTCVAGQGTVQTPGFALIVSQGTDAVSPAGAFPATRTRTMRATYSFKATGGLLHSYPGSTDLCFDAGPAMPPSAGTALTMQPCVPGAGRQTFTYRPNLTLVLTPSVTTASPLGMCLDAATPHAANALITFQPCATATVPNQQWSFDNSSNFVGTADGQTLDGFCFGATSPNTSGTTVALQSPSVCSTAPGAAHGFAPDAAAGFGAAGSGNGQVLSYGQYGRCLDVSNGDVNSLFLISYPCKQATNAVNVEWNQKWILPKFAAGASTAAGQISTSPPSASAYCLRSPLTGALGSYVRVLPCTTVDPGLTWTRFGDTGRYATSYQITDGAGLCLQPNDLAAVPSDLYNGFSKIVVAACNGSKLQKWNAPATASQPGALINVVER